MADNRVVIKINYDKDKNRKPGVEPKMITVWHTERIVVAAGILLLLISLPIYWFGGEEGDSDKDQVREIVDKAQPLNNNVQENKSADVSVNDSDQVKSAANSLDQSGRFSKDIKKEGAKRPTAIIFSRKVIRASLNSGLKDSEPYHPAELPVKVRQNQGTEVFYFTELRDIQDRNLYHVWAKNGRIVDKKQLSIKDSHAKVLSSRALTLKDKGEWQIQLVDNKGKVFSEFNFVVEPE